jgi:hypothetical protein
VEISPVALAILLVIILVAVGGGLFVSPYIWMILILAIVVIAFY